jgi:hypothetical protein
MLHGVFYLYVWRYRGTGVAKGNGMADVSDDQRLGEKIMEMIRSGYALCITERAGGVWIIGEKDKKTCSIIDVSNGSEHPEKTLVGMMSQIEKVMS